MTTIFFDYETGGVLPEQPSIQLAAIAVDDATGNELSSFEQKIAFDPAQCDPEALAKNHYNPEAWKGAIEPAAVAVKFNKFLEPHKCIRMESKKTGKPYFIAKGAGYNALTFDWPRLREMYGTAFLPVSYGIRDVYQRLLFYFDENQLETPENFQLATVCQYFGIDSAGAHDALADVRMTAKLYHKVKQLEFH